MTGLGTTPYIRTTASNRPGDYRSATANKVSRWDNVSQLAMWGVVYQSSNGSGFALEFIGDMHDSSASGSSGTAHEARGVLISGGKHGAGAGRGIN